jgi:hypothetical protein
MNISRFLVLSLVTALCSRGVEAQDSPKVDPLKGVVATAIAVRPGGNRERHELYVADDEAGSVKRISSDALDQPQDVLTGFGNGKAPTSILFINGRTLVAAFQGEPPGFQGYDITEDGKSLSAEQSKFRVRVADDVHGTSTGMATGSLGLFAVGVENDAGWVLRSRLRSSVPGDLKPFLKVGSRPTCAAISTRGWVVVGHAGKRDGGEDSRLTFHHPSDPAHESPLSIEPGLLDIAAIAYSPQGSMYVSDAAEADPQRGGIFRIEMDYQERTIGGKAVRVLTLENPTALAFAPDGSLYVIARENELLRVTDLE